MLQEVTQDGKEDCRMMRQWPGWLQRKFGLCTLCRCQWRRFKQLKLRRLRRLRRLRLHWSALSGWAHIVAFVALGDQTIVLTAGSTVRRVGRHFTPLVKQFLWLEVRPQLFLSPSTWKCLRLTFRVKEIYNAREALCSISTISNMSQHVHQPTGDSSAGTLAHTTQW